MSLDGRMTWSLDQIFDSIGVRERGGQDLNAALMMKRRRGHVVTSTFQFFGYWAH